MRNNKQLFVMCFSIVLFIALTIVPLSFSQSVSNSTSLAPQSNIPRGQETNSTVYITKTSTNSYNIVNDQTGLVGAFDTSYAITGNSNSLNKSKDIIISIIQADFDNSPTIGYVRAQNVTEGTGGLSPATSIANPFVDQQTINSTITQELSNTLNTAHSMNSTTVTIKCDFGMKIRDWKCETHGLA